MVGLIWDEMEREERKCVVDSKPFYYYPVYKGYDKVYTWGFAERRLCEACRKRWKERNNLEEGYRKDA